MARVKQVLLDKCQSTAPTEPTVRASLVRGSSWLESIRTAKANEMSSGTGRPVQFDADTTAEINGIRSSLMDLQSQVKTNMLLYEGLLIGARTCLEHEMELCEHLRRDYDPQSYMQGAQVQTYGDLMSEVIQVYEQLAEEMGISEQSAQTR
jgi:hypothetical protein